MFDQTDTAHTWQNRSRPTSRFALASIYLVWVSFCILVLSIAFAVVFSWIGGTFEFLAKLCLWFLVIAFPLGLILAVLCGGIALVIIACSRRRVCGVRLALKGICLAGGPLLLIVAILLLPPISPGHPARPAITCKSNMRQIGMTLHEYRAEHDGEMPPDLQTVYGLLPTTELLSCPRQRRNVFTLFVTFKLYWEPVDTENVDETSSYHYAWIKSTADPTVPLPLLWDKSPHSFGVNVLYPDGHVETISADEFKASVEENAEYYH